jgi:hypothetical protein
MLNYQHAPMDDLTRRFSRKGGGSASAAELEKLATELTNAKLSELNDALRRGTVDRPVKVITLIENAPAPAKVRGYITQERYLVNKTPREMREILGLPSVELLTGARVLGICEPLAMTHFESPAEHERRMGSIPAGRPPVQSWAPVSTYGLGSRAGQWNLIRDVRVVLIEDVQPGERYLRGQTAERTAD